MEHAINGSSQLAHSNRSESPVAIAIHLMKGGLAFDAKPGKFRRILLITK